MRKLPLLLIVGTTAIATVGGVMASGSDSCNYKEDGKYIMSDGTVAAFGIMNHAMHCTTQGLLPNAVAHRLGWLGNEETRR